MATERELRAGDRLGPYELLAHLGAGGMGEVWRARDPRLGREVAVKDLPAAMANDPQRVARASLASPPVRATRSQAVARQLGFVG